MSQLSYKIPGVHQLQSSIYAQIVSLSSPAYSQHVLRFFRRSELFLFESVFHRSGSANTQNTCLWDTGNPRGFQQHELNIRKVTACCAVQANGAEGQYYFNNDSVRGIDYYIGLDNFIRSKGQQINSSGIMLFSAVWSSLAHYRHGLFSFR